MKGCTKRCGHEEPHGAKAIVESEVKVAEVNTSMAIKLLI